MSFLLADLEQVFSNDDVFDAELLIDRDGVKNLREVEKHLWVASVIEQSPYEVEVRISPSKVLATSCECEKFRQSGKCAHLAAVLIQVRKQNQAKKEERQASKKSKAQKQDSSYKLTTKGILDQVEHNELVEFVKYYARYNRNFAIALKSRFASSVDGPNAREKYSQLLDAAIADSRRPDRSFSLRGVQKIAKILADLHYQMEGLMRKNWYAEVFTLLQNIIEKVTPILRKTDYKEELIPYIDKSFQHLKTLLSTPIPRALSDQIWNYGLNESLKLVYRNTGIDRKFLHLLIRMADGEERYRQLFEYLDGMIDRYYWEKRDMASLILAKLELLEKTGRIDEMGQLIDRSMNHADVIRYAIHRALTEKKYPRARKLAEQGISISLSSVFELEMEAVLLFVAEQEKDLSTILTKSLLLFEATYEIRYAQVAKAAAGDQWPVVRQETIDRLKQGPNQLPRAKAIAALLAEDNLLDELFEYISSKKGLFDLLMEYDRVLLPRFSNEVQQLYRSWLHHYLKDHVGRKPSKSIRHIVEHLYAIGAASIATGLITEFQHTYPERHSLIEELQALQSR